MKNNHSNKLKQWLAVIIMALFATASLLLFYSPLQPKKLTSMIGYAKQDNLLVHKDIFPASGLLTGMAYRCLWLDGLHTMFYFDFYIPDPEGLIRIWITPEDQNKLLEDPDREVHAYTVDILNHDTNRWVRYVAKHPHGHGAFFVIGIVLAVLSLVLVVKCLFFNPATKQFP